MDHIWWAVNMPRLSPGHGFTDKLSLPMASVFCISALLNQVIEKSATVSIVQSAILNSSLSVNLPPEN